MKTQYSINFKKYRKYCAKNNILIPSWMNHVIFENVIIRISEGQKLQACKYLCDLSNENQTRDGFGLKWSKTLVCDVIENFKVFKTKPEQVKPITPPCIVTSDEVKEVLAPFVKILKEVVASGKLHPVMKLDITSRDLYRVLALHEKMNSKIPADWFNK
jgi:hypothetical protein